MNNTSESFQIQDSNQQWHEILHKIIGLAQTGIHYSKDVYDIERYNEILMLVQRLYESQNISTDHFIGNVLADVGYATPKLDIRAVVFKDKKLLLVKETQDGLWSLPGGWADIGYSASENAVKEVFEETGLEVKVTQLLSLLDRRKHPHPPMALHVYKAFFLCEIVGGDLRGSVETTEVDFFTVDNLPPISEARVTKEQIIEFFRLAEENPNTTAFD